MSPLIASLTRAAARCPGKTALVIEEQRLSYAELDRRAQDLARRLLISGAAPGDRVALHMHNGAALAVSYFGCFYAGMIAVPINTRMNAPEIEYVLQHSDASLYIGQRSLFQESHRVSSCLEGKRQLVVDGNELEWASDSDPTIGLPPVAADLPAIILYTSGSTAHPKGVVHTHSSLLNAARGFDINSNDVVTIITPMVHSAAFMMLIATVDAAATAATLAAFEPHAVLEAIERHRGTYVLGMPVMYPALIAAQGAHARDLSSVTRFLAGGDAVSPTLQSAFVQYIGHPLFEIFGTTENGMVAANWSRAASHQGSFGYPRAG
jgi:acyl-CoA synthetase (AMP-forming)/AMP-acid ligase II